MDSLGVIRALISPTKEVHFQFEFVQEKEMGKKEKRERFEVS
jgi:hypothetical protein